MSGDVLTIGGTGSVGVRGKLVFSGAPGGMTDIEPRRWYHVVLVRQREKVRVHL